MERDENLGICLVTGAAGFLGRNIVRELLNNGFRVRALINNTPLAIEHDKLDIVKGDIRDSHKMGNALCGVDTVFHTASQIATLGGRFVSDAYEADAFSVNVKGTENLLAASIKAEASRFIYTSSIDVCFDGSHAPEMTETLGYTESAKSVYAKTKILAETLVLDNNGVDGLYTCSIRPDGIWGAESNDITDRIVAMLKSNLLKVRIGSADTLQDNTHVKNLVHSQLLSAKNLGHSGVASGKSYFISDGEPMNSFEFFRPLIEGLGRKVPTWELNAGVLRFITTLGEALHFLLHSQPPFLSPHELDRVLVTNYSSNSLASKELGYHPVIGVAEGMRECVEYYSAKISAVP